MERASKLAFLEKIFGKARYHANTKEAEFFSPFCQHHKPKLSINIESDHWRCWISNKNGKKLFFPIKEAGGSKADIREYIEKYKAKGVFVPNFKDIEDVEIDWPEGYKALASCKNSVLGKRAYKYLQGRGVSELDILRHKIGAAFDPDGVVFPSFDKKGKLNFFTSRAYTGRYSNPFVPKGYRNTIILNELNVDWGKPIVLTEGFVDMLKSIRNTIPLYGSFLHDEGLLFEKIVENNTEITLALDSDAWRKSEDLAKKLARYDVTVYTVDLGKYEDLGAMPKEAFLEAYEVRKEWSAEDSFLKRLRAVC